MYKRQIQDTPAEATRAVVPSAIEEYKAYIVQRLEKYPEPVSYTHLTLPTSDLV